MAKLRFLFVGDLHITDSRGLGGLSNYLPDHDRFVGDELRVVCDYAVKHKIKYIVLGGDLAESPSMSNSAHNELITLARDYSELQFIAILGNHDMVGADPSMGHSLEVLDTISNRFKESNFRIITKPTIMKLGDAQFNFLPWPHASFRDDCINIAHIEVNGSQISKHKVHSSGDESDAQVLCGHLHDYHKVRNTHYIGTLYQTNFGEAEKKYFADCTVERGKLDVTLVRHYPAVVLRTITWGSEVNAENVNSYVADAQSKDEVVLFRLLHKRGEALPDKLHPRIVQVTKSKTDYTEPDAEFQLDTLAVNRTISTDDMFGKYFEECGYGESKVNRLLALRRKIISGELRKTDQDAYVYSC